MVLTAIEWSIAGDLHNWLIVSVYRAHRLPLVAENNTKRAVLFGSASTLVSTVGQEFPIRVSDLLMLVLYWCLNPLLSATGMLHTGTAEPL